MSTARSAPVDTQIFVQSDSNSIIRGPTSLADGARMQGRHERMPSSMMGDSILGPYAKSEMSVYPNSVRDSAHSANPSFETRACGPVGSPAFTTWMSTQKHMNATSGGSKLTVLSAQTSSSQVWLPEQFVCLLHAHG